MTRNRKRWSSFYLFRLPVQVPSSKALSSRLLSLPRFIIAEVLRGAASNFAHERLGDKKTGKQEKPCTGDFFFQLAVNLAVWTAVAFVWYGSHVHQTGEWPRTAPRMTALSSCEKAGKKKLKKCEKHYEVKAIIIQRHLSSSAPIEGGWVDRGARQKNAVGPRFHESYLHVGEVRPLFWLVAAYVWFSTFFCEISRPGTQTSRRISGGKKKKKRRSLDR